MIRWIGGCTAALALGLAVLAGSVEGGLAIGGEDTMVRPLDAARISQPFGCTSYAFEPLDPACPGGHIHFGADLVAPGGTPVRAIGAGTVRIIRSDWGYGLHVLIDHGDQLTSLYGHLSAVAVSNGQYVTAGDVIGSVGSTGNSTGPHLHFEIRRNGVPEDPQRDITLP